MAVNSVPPGNNQRLINLGEVQIPLAPRVKFTRLHTAHLGKLQAMAGDLANSNPSLAAAPSNPAQSTHDPSDIEKSRNNLGTPSGSNGVLQDLEKGTDDDGNAPTPEKGYLVEFDGPKDPGNPKNWTTKRRWAITISMGLTVFTVTFASSIFSVNIRVVQEKFDVNLVTATLGVALFVLGFVFG